MNKEEASIAPNWNEIAKILKYKEKDFNNLLNNFLEHKNKIYSEIKTISKQNRNFENTVLALENSDATYTDKLHQINVYSITHKNKKYRDLANNFIKDFAKIATDIEYDKDIYKSFMEYYEENYKKENKDLDKKYGEGSIKLVEDINKVYKRMGFDLNLSIQTKLKNNIKKISELSINFLNNISEHRDYILLNKDELRGLPENYINTLEKVDNKYKISLDYPVLHPFLKYSDIREKRKEIMDKDYKKGGKKNVNILGELLKLRNENAKILGFNNFADFQTENRMAKSEKNVRDFIESLINKLYSKSEKSLKEMNQFAINNLDQYKNIKSIDYYDIAYVANKLKENKFSYDSAKLKEYFELEHILKIMFSIFGEMFDFTVKEVKDIQTKKILVDKDIKIYEFKDKKTKKIISYLILDLFPREGKYGHACSAEFITEKYIKGKRVIPINELICNFPKPNKKLPSLLALGEVETLFHELGHGLHYMLSNVIYETQAGYNVVWDFAETPSQMLENFLFEEANLNKLAIHYKTGHKLDKKIINKIIESKNFLNSYNYLGINILSLYDLNLHSNRVKLNNIAKHYIDLFKKYKKMDLPKDNIFPAGFGHLIDYSAGYYSYMWALVYADDFYSEFKKVGDNKNKLKEIGGRYRKEILEVGGSRDENESVKRFLGRKSNNKTFLNNLKS